MARALGLAALLCSAAALAGTFSPGPLAKGHAALEGLDNCSKCHPAGGRLSSGKCLDCHTELKDRVARGLGLHGRMKEAERQCAKCHHDHQGEDFDMIDWGKEGQSRFDHARTGWPLNGKHATTACKACHDPRLLVSAEVKKLLAEHPGRTSWLGTATDCAGCHFDDHRGQEGPDCKRCHDEKAWKPAPGFDHDKASMAAYPLEGAHAKVRCDQCHTTQTDTSHRGAFPKPVAEVFQTFKPVAHDTCLTCHADPHESRFGRGCTDCHSLNSWKELHTVQQGRGADRRFHETTRYPLRGLHEHATCASCHGTGAGARFKGVPFALCTDCHADAHRGQLTRADGGAAGRADGRADARLPDCTRCHSVEGFLPARFDLEEHAQTRYPLLGAHQATPCLSCHVRDAAKAAVAAPEALRAGHVKRSLAPKLSPAVFLVPGDLQRCETCHEDVHAGQFERSLGGAACTRCHLVDSFRTLRFDHATSLFPLEGKHATAACQGCHRAAAPPAPVAFRPLPLLCAGCHADAHAGQFGLYAECSGCHDAKAWKPAPRFTHAPPTARWALEGKHATAACKSCHPEVDVGGGVRAVRYKPLALECEGCHVDQHDGTLARFSARHGMSADTRCAACHVTSSWKELRFDHAGQTRVPLEGAHLRAACSGCHDAAFQKAVPVGCSACHQDAHRGSLGARCEGCHGESTWESRFRADAHRNTAFPLSGRHALVTCTECHGNVRDRSFSRTGLACVACHQRDYARTTGGPIDHQVYGFGTACYDCHTSARFTGARFAQHEACFQLATGPHAGIACLQCHSSLTAARPDGKCATGTEACTHCHTHSQSRTDPRHARVPGYQFSDPKCYSCHPFVASVARPSAPRIQPGRAR